VCPKDAVSTVGLTAVAARHQSAQHIGQKGIVGEAQTKCATWRGTLSSSPRVHFQPNSIIRPMQSLYVFVIDHGISTVVAIHETIQLFVVRFLEG
jgi:hypothetical protein